MYLITTNFGTLSSSGSLSPIGRQLLFSSDKYCIEAFNRSGFEHCLHVCIRFSQPPNSLFKKDEVDSVQTLFWSNMDKHAEYAEVQYNQVDNNTPIYQYIYYLQYFVHQV